MATTPVRSTMRAARKPADAKQKATRPSAQSQAVERVSFDISRVVGVRLSWGAQGVVVPVPRPKLKLEDLRIDILLMPPRE